MTFQEIYNLILPLWPKNIDISDGGCVGIDGFHSANLSSIYGEIDKQIDFKADPWKGLGAWSFFQAIHKEAEEFSKKGYKTMAVGSLSLIHI